MFNAIKRAIRWSELNRDMWLDFLRIWLGIALFVKGLSVLRLGPAYAADLAGRHLIFGGEALVQYAALAHFIGGTMLVFGILTRLAALIQIPNVVGAIIFIHGPGGLFSLDQGLQAAMVTLVLLVLFAFTGAGRISTEWYFRDHPRRLAGETEELMRQRETVRH